MSMETNNTFEPSKLGNWLKAQRLELGITLSEAAGRAGITFQRLSAIETGSVKVDINNFEKASICKTYRIIPSELETNLGN